MTDIDGVTSVLSETIRKERRLLLITSTLLLVVVHGGLRPSKIAALGIDFSPSNFGTLLSILFAIHVFNLVAFGIATSAEGRAWRLRFSAVRQGLAKKIHESRLKLSDGLLHPADKLTGALTAIGELVNDADAHLSSATVKDTRYTLSLADVAARFEVARQKEESIKAFDAYREGTDDPDRLYLIEHVGIDRAILQKEIDDYYAQLRQGRGVRAMLVRRFWRKHLAQMWLNLRYMPLSHEDIQSALNDVERLRTLAGLDTSERVSLDELRERLDEVDKKLNSLTGEAKNTVNRFTQMALSGPLDGITSAAWRLHDHLGVIDDDIARSLARFGRNAFWEIDVPILIATVTLLFSLLQTYLDGMLL